jgi:hypothetical protein
MHKTTNITHTTKMAAPANTENSSLPGDESFVFFRHYVTIERQDYFTV